MKKTIKQYLQERVEKGGTFLKKPITHINSACIFEIKLQISDSPYTDYSLSIYDILYSPESNFWQTFRPDGGEMKDNKALSVRYKDGPIAYLESIERPE